MKVIIGLKNPGSQYAQTRHNAGCLFVEWLIKQKVKVRSTVNSSRYTLHNIINQNIFVCLPETYMNQSGKALQSLLKKYPNITSKDILVAHDDLQHKTGNVRIKDGGSAQGHNGVQSIIREIRTNNFKRLQIGIGRPASRQPDDVAKYVLSKFGRDQFQVLKQKFIKGYQLAKQHQFI